MTAGRLARCSRFAIRHPERGRRLGGQRQAPGSDVNHHEVAQTFVYLSRREALDVRRQSIHMPLAARRGARLPHEPGAPFVLAS